MRKLTYTELLHQRLTLEHAQRVERHPIIVVLDNIRSLYNVGSIFRTADAVRVRELILCGYTPSPPRPEIDKTALGATQSVPWRAVASCVAAVRELRHSGIRVFAVELTDESRPYDSLTPEDFPAAFVFGNEIVGVQPEVLQYCHAALAIPMYGVKHSLNVAVAAGIVLYEALRHCRDNAQQEILSRRTNHAAPHRCPDEHAL
jgi:tRNA G18 (ribose-2'-O)-methylase SpoU